MRRIDLLTFSGVLVVLVAIVVPSNLSCRVFFPPGSTTRLTFSFGWPLAYFDGPVPRPGIRSEMAPNFIWGFPEMNDDDETMTSIRERHLSGLSLTPWGMREYGEFHLLGLVVNALLVVAVWLIACVLWVRLVQEWEFQNT